MEYYKVRYQERPEVKVIVEKVDADESKGQLSTIYSYVEDGKAGSFAVRETKEEAFNALKDSIKRVIETNKKCIEDAEKKLSVINKYDHVIDFNFNPENVTKKDGIKAFRSFKIGDVVTNGDAKYIVKNIDKDSHHSYLIEEVCYDKPDEEKIQYWVREDRLRFWKDPEFKVGDLVEIKLSGKQFRIEKVKLANFIWYYGYDNPTLEFESTNWLTECDLRLILEPDTEPETEPVCGDSEDVKITIDKIIDNKLDEKISNLRNELLDYISESKPKNNTKLTKEEVVTYFKNISDNNILTDDQVSIEDCNCPWKEECSKCGAIPLCTYIAEPETI